MDPNDQQVVTDLTSVRDKIKGIVDTHTANAATAATNRDNLAKQSQDQDGISKAETSSAAEHQSVLDEINGILAKLNPPAPTPAPATTPAVPPTA